MVPEERLDEMRARIVKARKRDLVQSIAVEVMEDDGDYAAIPSLFEERWEEPGRDEVDRQVAGKIASGIDWLEQELRTHIEGAERVQEKVDKYNQLLVHAQASSDNSEAMERLKGDLDDFRALQTYLAVEPTPPSGATRAARAGTAEIKSQQEED